MIREYLPFGLVDPACPINWAHPMNYGLVADWTTPPNSGWSGGLTLRDLARGGKNPNDGTLTNGPTWSGNRPPGAIGQSIKFDGTNDHIVTASGTTFGLTGADASAFAWINTTSVSTYQIIFGKDNATTRDWGFGLGNTSAKLIFYRAVGTFPIIESSAVITADEWQHVGFTKISTTMTLYRNGVSIGSGTNAETAGPSTSIMRIGSREYSGFEQYFSGSIYGPRYYSRGLSAAEVAALYNEQRTGSRGLYNWVDVPAMGPEAAASTFKAFLVPTRSHILGGGIL